MDHFTTLTHYRTRIDLVLEECLENLTFQSNPLFQAMHHGVLLGGKRMRPFLVYATGEMFGIDSKVLDVPAAAIEFIHAYSLIHDDLPAMDDDSLRRGQPTCHIAFGEDTAILAGDGLLTQAFSILSEKPMSGVNDSTRIAMITELARASGAVGMVLGQALDLQAEGKTVNVEDLETIHRHKTGALIRAAIRLGALTAGERSRPYLPLLDRYAEAIGLAFQVQDDILDVTGDSQITGKQQGMDLALGKSTYPGLLGLEPARHKAKELYQEAVDALAQLEKHGFNTQQLQALASYIVERNK
ncbi:(2E,6E)-farnesyl diphosphate synthase [Rosenbergiella australiborealis]|uniref:(2E,6E)-farnesyl diphosphate synthase n=1 Tax=Rosenbergiella australiborealis TaxID=1544696 RepID=A0ABS5T6U4_9GAMM|nr:(2E,6E)-farnesyl diphosphate synthase [Rosenbergiella australiborealis]MBT0728080.1 (2E,6E)-farnesyl diphosphate synthase [Rosenbergiella australiborealis]